MRVFNIGKECLKTREVDCSVVPSMEYVEVLRKLGVPELQGTSHCFYGGDALLTNNQMIHEMLDMCYESDEEGGEISVKIGCS